MYATIPAPARYPERHIGPDPPVAAAVLSIVGGVLMILFGTVLLLTGSSGCSYPGGPGIPVGSGSVPTTCPDPTAIGFVFVTLGLLVTTAGALLLSAPRYHPDLGSGVLAAALVAAALSILLGPTALLTALIFPIAAVLLLPLLGGLLALVWRPPSSPHGFLPSPARWTPLPAPIPEFALCLRCGWAHHPVHATFCSHCGAQLGGAPAAATP